MSSFPRRFLETLAFGLLLLLVTAPNMKDLWAQGASLMMGRTSGGLNKIFLTDSNGQLGVSGVSVTVTSVSISGVDGASGQFPVNISGVSPSGGVLPVSATFAGSIGVNGISAVSSASPQSGVSITNAGTTQLAASNTSRRILLIQNLDTTYAARVGTVSPVSATNSLYLPAAGGSFYQSAQTWSDAWYALGLSAAASTILYKESN